MGRSTEDPPIPLDTTTCPCCGVAGKADGNTVGAELTGSPMVPTEPVADGGWAFGVLPSCTPLGSPNFSRTF